MFPILPEAAEAPDSATRAGLHLLRFAEDLLGAVELHAQGRYGLSAGRLSLLLGLARAETQWLRPAELAEQLRVTRATVTGLLDALESAGLVARRRDPCDRRGIRVALTGAGRALVGRIAPGHALRLGAVMRALSDDDRVRLAALLDKVRAGFDALRGP